MCEKFPSNEVELILGKFPHIYFVKGSPSNEKNLLATQIERASKAVIFGSSEFNKDKGETNPDAENMFTYKAIQKYNPDIQIIIEMMIPKNLQFLNEHQSKIYSPMTANNDNFQYEMTSLYAAGEMYHSGIVDILACQAFYNPHLLTILQQILIGVKVENYQEMALYSELGLEQSNLLLREIPCNYVGESFEELFKHFCFEKNLICLGLYRYSL